MQLVFALYKYFPFGGLQRDMLAIARECAARGHQVSIFCQSWSGEYPEDPGIHINILRDQRRWWQNGLQGNSNHHKNSRFHRDLGMALARMQPDALVAFNRIPGADVYYAADTCFKAKLYGERPWLYRLLPRYRQFVRDEAALFAPTSTTRILSIAPAAAEEYQHYYHTSPERFVHLPPGIARSRINESGERLTVIQEELGLPTESHVILMVGSGFRTKGLDRAIEALAALPEVLRSRSHLVIVGEDRSDSFQEQARSRALADRVHFLGGRKDVPQLLKSADVLIHPAYRENTGTVLLEAAVAGLPVIATAVCGYAHYIADNELGLVVPQPFEQTQLNRALEQALVDRAQQNRWRENSRRFAASADIYDMPRHAAAAIEQVTRNRKQKP